MAFQYNRGKRFDDWVIGEELETPGRTITEADIVNFACLTGDFDPLHTNEEFAKNTVHGGRIAHGALVYSFGIGLMNQLHYGEGTTVGYLGGDIKFTSTVRAGDTIHVVSKCVGKRLSRSKPDRGIVEHETRILNQRGEVVCEQHGTVMVLV